MSERRLAPGWYADPRGEARERWFDGAGWTDATRGPPRGRTARPASPGRRIRNFRWGIVAGVAAFVAAGAAWAVLVDESLPSEAETCRALEPLDGLPVLPARFPRWAEDWEPARASWLAVLETEVDAYAAAAATASGTRRTDLEAAQEAAQATLDLARLHDPPPRDAESPVIIPAPRRVDDGAEGVAVGRFTRSCGITRGA